MAGKVNRLTSVQAMSSRDLGLLTRTNKLRTQLAAPQRPALRSASFTQTAAAHRLRYSAAACFGTAQLQAEPIFLEQLLHFHHPARQGMSRSSSVRTRRIMKRACLGAGGGLSWGDSETAARPRSENHFGDVTKPGRCCCLAAFCQWAVLDFRAARQRDRARARNYPAERWHGNRGSGAGPQGPGRCLPSGAMRWGCYRHAFSSSPCADPGGRLHAAEQPGRIDVSLRELLRTWFSCGGHRAFHAGPDRNGT